MASGPPSGTVTFLFTDIVGSSRLWESRPQAMRSALARHDEVLRGAVARHGGTIFSTGGDGVAAAFGRAASAVTAAIEIQQALADDTWPPEVELCVRMALHTGEAEERDGDYFGPTLNRAARLMAEAAGGEVLLSLATAEVVGWQLGEGISLLDVGDMELRGLARPERVWQLMWPGTRAKEIRASGPRVVGNLPPARRLLGRDREIGEVRQLVEQGPLVTLTGVGGVGKTSLAVAVANLVAPTLRDGGWACELAMVLSGEDVTRAVGETLSLRPQAGLTALELISRVMAHHECLLVLDNCEHVLDAAAQLAEAVVRRCPAVTILATSREPLGVPGERLVALAPLDQLSAAALFRERAAEHKGAFEVGDDGLISELCASLDGLPLAIELAAARSRSMPLADLVSRLGQRFRLLQGQRRAALRHQTLGATVAWSYDLLASDEQRVFDRLSVFSGGFDLDAAEAVCADDELDAIEVDRLVASLVDKSMVLPGVGGRYVLLETLRQFGEERLSGTREPEQLRHAHLRWFTSLVVAAHDGLQGPNEGAWWRRLQADWANVRSAFTGAVAEGDVEAAATIATNLVWAAAWRDTGEPCLWIETVAAMPGVEASPQWANVLTGLAWAAWAQGDLAGARARGLQAIAAEPPGVPNIDLIAEFCIYSSAFFAGDRTVARRYIDRCGERARESGMPVIESINWSSAAICHYGHLELQEALEASRRALALAESVGNPTALAWALAHMASAMAALRDPSAAEVAERSLAIAKPAGAVMPMFTCLGVLAALYMADGRQSAAAALTLDAMQSMRRKAAWIYAQQTVMSAVRILGRGATAGTAAQLVGAVRRSSAAGGPHIQRYLNSAARHLAEELGEQHFAELCRLGESLGVERAVLMAEEALVSIAGEEATDLPK